MRMNVFQELKKFLHQILNSVEGLHSILITDRDGVPLISVADERAPELAMRASFLSTFGMATDQGSKLGLGKNKTLISMYSSYQHNRAPPDNDASSEWVTAIKLGLVPSIVGGNGGNVEARLANELHTYRKFWPMGNGKVYTSCTSSPDANLRMVIQMNKLPLVISFIASNSCDTGHILSLESKVDPILQNLKNVVAEA